MIHSSIGASGMYRWSQCPGSVNHLADNPMPSNAYADEGTKAHDLAEQILKNNTMVLSDTLSLPADVDDEMLENVLVYVNYCRELAQGKEYAIEQEFSLKYIDERAFGTNDFSCWKDFKSLDIVDLKYGIGVEVFPEGNKQLMYYALGCVMENDLDVNEINLHIVQPRIDDPIKKHTITFQELMDFRVELEEAIKRVDLESNSFHVGDHCRFCNQQKCPAYIEKMESEAMVKVDSTMEIANPESLEVDQLMKVYDFIPMIQSYVKTVQALVNHKASTGDVDLSKYGKKLVTKLKNTSWKSEIPFEELGLTEDDAYVRKPKTPAQVKKLIDKSKYKAFEQSVQRLEDGYKIVKESAKGDAVSLSAPATLELN